MSTDCTYFRNFKLLAFFCDCTDRFVSDMVGNPEDRFSRVAAQMLIEFFVRFVHIYKIIFIFSLVNLRIVA